MDRDPSNNTPKPDNITPFRRDWRPAVVGALRSMALLLMLGTLLYGVWAYQDDLRLDNIRRLISYARAASREGEAGFGRYSFEPGLDTVYAPFELGLAVVSSDTYRFVTGFGDTGFSAQLKYGDPAMVTGERQVLIYDRGNTGYSVANGYSILYSGTAQSPILSAAMNPRGDYVLVVEESGYRAGVYVYDSRSKPLCVWQTPSCYVLLASLSPEGDRFAVQCIEEREGRMAGQVRVYDIGQEQPAFTVDLGERQVCALRHYKNGSLLILCEDGLLIYDREGSLVAEPRFSGLVRFAHHEGDLPLVALRAGWGVGEEITVRAYDETGAVTFESQVPGALRDVDYRGGRGLLLFYDKLYRLDITARPPAFWGVAAAGERRVLCAPTGQGILVYADRAESDPMKAPGSP